MVNVYIFDTFLCNNHKAILIDCDVEVGEAAENGLSVFSQKNKSVVAAFENIAELIVSKT